MVLCTQIFTPHLCYLTVSRQFITTGDGPSSWRKLSPPVSLAPVVPEGEPERETRTRSSSCGDSGGHPSPCVRFEWDGTNGQSSTDAGQGGKYDKAPRLLVNLRVRDRNKGLIKWFSVEFLLPKRSAFDLEPSRIGWQCFLVVPGSILDSPRQPQAQVLGCIASPLIGWLGRNKMSPDSGFVVRAQPSRGRVAVSPCKCVRALCRLGESTTPG